MGIRNVRRFFIVGLDGIPVAEVIELGNGKAITSWMTDTHSVTVWDNLAEAFQIHVGVAQRAIREVDFEGAPATRGS